MIHRLKKYRKKIKKMIMLIVAIVILVVFIVGTLTFFLLTQTPENKKQTKQIKPKPRQPHSTLQIQKALENSNVVEKVEAEREFHQVPIEEMQEAPNIQPITPQPLPTQEQTLSTIQPHEQMNQTLQHESHIEQPTTPSVKQQTLVQQINQTPTQMNQTQTPPVNIHIMHIKPAANSECGGLKTRGNVSQLLKLQPKPKANTGYTNNLQPVNSNTEVQITTPKTESNSETTTNVTKTKEQTATNNTVNRKTTNTKTNEQVQTTTNNTVNKKTNTKTNEQVQTTTNSTITKNKEERYTDPKEAICINTRAECGKDNNKGCYLGSGHLDYQACMEKAEQIDKNVRVYNNKLDPNKPKKLGVKFVSWAPAHVNPMNKHPQCMIFDETAEIKNNEVGWKTYVKDPKYFDMTSDPSLYMAEGLCPCKQ